jgi:uncharacterized membrane protein YoaK (UPF0700 family)
MTLLSITAYRRRVHDHLLGASTASVAGLVNVCSVMAFFAFASNVTGHVAILAEELVKGHVHQLSVVAVWLLLFLLGAGISNACAYHEKGEPPSLFRSASPLVIEALLLAGVGFYGSSYYAETLRETEVLVGILLFAMGLQNGLVATISGGVVKTTHLTGLLTDLGMEIALFLRPTERKSEALRFKLTLHAVILAFYVSGGIVGGLLFNQMRFFAFYVGSFMLLGVLANDLVLARTGAGQMFQKRIGWLGKSTSSKVHAPAAVQALSANADGTVNVQLEGLGGVSERRPKVSSRYGAARARP